MMNEAVIQLYRQLGMSKYALAKRAGLPYTTVNEILNQKIDLNKCTAETVSRLAAALNCHTEDILNRYPVMDQVSGRYRDVRYRWQRGKDNMELLCRYKGKTFVIDMHQPYSIPSRRQYYEQFALWQIDEWLEQNAFEEKSRRLLSEINDAE